MSPAMRNLVSPPARSTPLVRMEFMDWKMTMNKMAFISAQAISLASGDT